MSHMNEGYSLAGMLSSIYVTSGAIRLKTKLEHK